MTTKTDGKPAKTRANGTKSRKNLPKTIEIQENARIATDAELRDEVAAPNIFGNRSPWLESVITGLNPQRLSSILSSSDSADIREMLTLAQEMEERDPHYASLLQTRKMAVRSMTFKVEPSGDLRRDRQLAEEVQELIDAQEFQSCIFDMLDAIGKGYSVVEIIWDTSSVRKWTPERYVWQPPHFFKFEHIHGRELLLLDADAPMGKEMPENKFIVHRCKTRSGETYRSGTARVAAFFYLAKSYAIKDWVQFCEVYGFPLRMGKHSPNATDADRQRLLAAIASMGSNAFAVIPTTVQIETAEGVSGSHGSEVFGGMLQYIDSQMSKLVLGQTMTSDNGSSQSQAVVHDRVRNDILWADAKALEDTINTQLIKPYVRLNYGDIAAPKLRITQDEKEDLSVLGQALIPFIDRGLIVSMAEIAKKFGLTEPDAVKDPLVPQQVASAQPEDMDESGDDSNDDDEDEQMALNARRKRKKRNTPDDIERKARQASSEWEKIISPMVDPILNAIAGEDTLEDAQAAVGEVLSRMDNTLLIQHLATETFKRRVEASERVRNQADV